MDEKNTKTKKISLSAALLGLHEIRERIEKVENELKALREVESLLLKSY